jgi:hypothetical protein
VDCDIDLDEHLEGARRPAAEPGGSNALHVLGDPLAYRERFLTDTYQFDAGEPMPDMTDIIDIDIDDDGDGDEGNLPLAGELPA